VLSSQPIPEILFVIDIMLGNVDAALNEQKREIQ
jgi:hypothetical protein